MLDSWTITDAHEELDFRVEITRDEFGGRPQDHADIYNAEEMEKQGDRDGAEWARRAVSAWQRDEWQFATVEVTPVSGDEEFTSVSVGMCGYGTFPPGGGAPAVVTTGRDYVREAWANDLITEAISVFEATMRKRKEVEQERVDKLAEIIAHHTGVSPATSVAAAMEIAAKGLVR